MQITQNAKKCPLSFSPSAPSPLRSPLAQRIRADLQIGECEVESPERELLRSNNPLRSPPPQVHLPVQRSSICLRLWSLPLLRNWKVQDAWIVKLKWCLSTSVRLRNLKVSGMPFLCVSTAATREVATTLSTFPWYASAVIGFAPVGATVVKAKWSWKDWSLLTESGNWTPWVMKSVQKHTRLLCPCTLNTMMAFHAQMICALKMGRISVNWRSWVQFWSLCSFSPIWGFFSCLFLSLSSRLYRAAQ